MQLKKTNGKKNKLNKRFYFRLIIFSILILIIIILAVFFISKLIILDKVEIYTEAILGKTPGFDLNGTALTFGRVVPENAGSRSIDIKNEFDKRILVSIVSEGDISNFLIVSENDFILMPGENKTVGFSVLFPAIAEMR